MALSVKVREWIYYSNRNKNREGENTKNDSSQVNDSAAPSDSASAIVNNSS